MVFFSSRISPLTSTVIFFDRSPLATAVVTCAMLRTCAVRLPAIELTLSVRSFQVPDTPSNRDWDCQIARHRLDDGGEVLPGAPEAFRSCLSAELALGTHLARHPRDLGG